MGWSCLPFRSKFYRSPLQPGRSGAKRGSKTLIRLKLNMSLATTHSDPTPILNPPWSFPLSHPWNEGSIRIPTNPSRFAKALISKHQPQQ